MNAPRSFLHVLLLLGVTAQIAQAARILLVPYAVKSHVSYFSAIGKELKANGHEVYVFIAPTYPALKDLQSQFDVITHHTPDPDIYNQNIMDTATKKAMLSKILGVPAVTSLRFFGPMSLSMCTNALSDDKVYEKLRGMNFDLSVADAFCASRCLYILLYRLGLPYISVTTQFEPWLNRNPALPSFVPFPMANSYTEKMTFWQRLHNLLGYIDWFVWPRLAYLDDSLIAKYAPEKPKTTINYLVGQSKLWFQNSDVVLDYARPTMPNMVEVGGLTIKPAKPLEKDYKAFVESAKNGVVVITFGSIVEVLPDDINERFFKAFRKSKFHFIWRYNDTIPAEVPSNVKISPWIPQNDLLAHPNTKLFITHCGNNGQFEAMYHKVPMIGFPIFGDQGGNAARMQYKGYGTVLNMLTFTPDELVQHITDIINNPIYKEKITKASNIYQSRKLNPPKRALYWIEHILKYGGDHLHSYALEMAWYEYLMLDILALVLAVSALTTVLVWYMCKAVCRRCCRRQQQKIKKS